MTIRGISHPMAVTRSGKLASIDDAAYLDQLIMLGLSDCESENPFQDLGFPMELLFQSQSSDNLARIEGFVREFFEGLREEGIAQLQELAFSQDQGAVFVQILYLNLFNGQTSSLIQTFV